MYFWKLKKEIMNIEKNRVAGFSEPLDTTTTGYATVVSSVVLSRDATSIASGIKCNDRTGAIRRWDVHKA